MNNRIKAVVLNSAWLPQLQIDHSVTLDSGWLNKDVKTYAEKLRRARFIRKAKGLTVCALMMGLMSFVGAIETGVIYVP